MSLPQKKKFDININPVKVGIEYLKYGFDRIEELMLKTDSKTTYLPKGIGLEVIKQKTATLSNKVSARQ